MKVYPTILPRLRAFPGVFPTRNLFEVVRSGAFPLAWLSGQRRGALLAVALAATFFIGCLDYLSGSEISWFVIYIFPIALIAWYVGPRYAYVLSALSVFLWISGEFATGLTVSSWLVPVWNSLIRLTFYYVFIALLSYVRAVTNDLEAAVRARTASLTREIAERERLERELLEMGERERRRIGYDLHDGLGQQLTGTALAVQVLRKRLLKRGLPEAEEAGKAVALIQESITLAHTLAKGLQPVEMHAGGLMHALQEYAAATAEMFKVSCLFGCDAPVLVSDVGVADHLYRITQEATGNAIRHGQASRIVISLSANEEGTVLRIADNGVGMTISNTAPSGMGMRIMRERAKLIGAKFSVESVTDVALKTGTVVVCVLPHPERYAHEGHNA